MSLDDKPDFYTKVKELKTLNSDILLSVLSDLDSDSQILLLTQIISDLNLGFEDISLALKTNDTYQMHSVSHRFKTLCGTFGFDKLALASEAVCDAEREGQIHTVTVISHWLAENIMPAIHELKQEDIYKNANNLV
ncbi:hypothetical protein QGN29_02735 [Temperatibacter marinus]|uniref:HPt domain-containing protein n=1 Tax=Temperatibacter marinus TaxID=1456591 RepID=A0AA52EJ85_9PROT|nr:hypothetical protein [Temperatibacter marinus]WND03284.1 hypothetical protein QGN29_02735 [Temperatibacter marinus]